MVLLSLVSVGHVFFNMLHNIVVVEADPDGKDEGEDGYTDDGDDGKVGHDGRSDMNNGSIF